MNKQIKELNEELSRNADKNGQIKFKLQLAWNKTQAVEKAKALRRLREHGADESEQWADDIQGVLDEEQSA